MKIMAHMNLLLLVVFLLHCIGLVTSSDGGPATPCGDATSSEVQTIFASMPHARPLSSA